MIDGDDLWKNPTTTVPEVRKITGRWHVNGRSSTYDDAGVLVFQCPQSGYYSIESLWKTSFSTNYTEEYIGVRIASDENITAKTLWEVKHSGYPSDPGYTDDLSSIERLQNMYLTQGSYIFFSMRCKPNNSLYPNAYNYFYNLDDSAPGGQIRCIVAPEPIRFNFSSPVSTNPQSTWSLCYADGRAWEKKSDLSLMIDGQVGSVDCWKNADDIYPYVKI